MKRSKKSRREQAALKRLAKARRAQNWAELLYRAAYGLLALVEAREAALAKRERRLKRRHQTVTKRAKPKAKASRKHAGDSPKRGRQLEKRARAGAPAGHPVTWVDLPAEAGGGVSTPSELERARLEALLQRAHLDPLTGAFRREAGRLALRNEIDRARRGDGRFVLAFVDVDGLKERNDADGHGAGDHLLRTLVAIMRANLRSYDPIVRVGGDEFVCGIASIDEDEARHRLDAIDQSLRHATGTGVTAGLATLSSNETLDELVARADSALIEAKRERH